MTAIRPFVLALLSFLTALGLVPPQLVDLIDAHPELVLAVTLAAWAYTAWSRNRKARLATQEGSGINLQSRARFY